MPANYALFRFGGDVVRQLPPELRRSVQRSRRLFDGGLHGRDLFFYYSPAVKTRVGARYDGIGAMTGKDFFEQAVSVLRKNPSEGATACLYGLLGHYCLSVTLAPLFRQALAADGRLRAVELEVELDRYLLGLDRKLPAHAYDLSTDLKLTWGECVTLSGFFPGTTPGEIHKAMKKMMYWTRRMAAKNRRFTAFLLKLTRPGFRDQWMADHANHKGLHLDQPMLDCYRQAVAAYPEMARQLTEYVQNGTPLGEAFSQTFV